MPSDRSPCWCRVAVRRRPPWFSRDSVATTGALYVLVLFAAAVVVTGDLSCVGLGPQDATAEKNIPCPVEKQCSFQKLQFIFSRQPKIHYLWFLRGLKISDDRKNRNSSSSVCDFGKHLPTILILAVLLFVAEMTTLPMTYLMGMAMQPVVGVFSGLLHAFQASSNLQVPLDSKFELQETPSINVDPVPWSEFYYSSYMCKYELLLDSLATRVLLFMLLVMAGDVERNPGPINGGTKPTLGTLLYFPCTIKGEKNIIRRVAVRYRFLCTFLLKDEQGARLANIDKQASYIPEDAMHIIFTRWLQEDTECSWEKLISSLRKCELYVVAQDMEDALGDPPSEGPAKPGSSVSPERYKYLHLKLYADSQKIALQFFSLTNTTMKVLISNHVSVEEVKSYAIRFPLIKSEREPKLADIIEPAQTIYKIFDILENEHYITFHNFKLLESIIDELCKENSKPLREELEKYRTDFRQYIERRVFESSLYYEGKFKPEAVTEGCNLLLIMDENWRRDTTLKRTIELQIYVCRIFDIAYCTLRLEVIKSNSLHLYYAIPACVERHILSMTKVQANLLIKEGIIQMDCGDQCIVLKEYAWKCVQNEFTRKDGCYKKCYFDTFKNARGFCLGKGRIFIHDINYDEDVKGQKFAVHVLTLSEEKEMQLLFSIGGNFEEIRGIAVDEEGSIYVADAGNYRIVKFGKEGNYMYRSEKYSSSSSSSAAKDDFHYTLCRPYSIVVVDDRVFVSDNQLNKVQVLRSSDLQPLFDTKPNDIFLTPRDIAYSSEMFYLVGHPRRPIVTFKVNSNKTAIDHSSGLIEWNGIHKKYFEHRRLRSIAIYKDLVFISERDQNKVVHFKIGLCRDTVKTMSVHNPVMLMADKDELYILHGFRGCKKLKVIRHDEWKCDELAGNFSVPENYGEKFSREDAKDDETLVYGTPRGIALSPEGHIFMTDGLYNRKHQAILYMVRKFSGYEKEEFRIVGSFQGPRGITVDDKFIYVADTEHNRILKFTVEGKYEAKSDLYTDKPQNLLLCRPYGVLLHHDLLFVCDKDHGQIVIFDTNLKLLSTTDTSDIFNPTDIAFSKEQNKIFVVGPPENKIMVFEVEEKKLVKTEVRDKIGEHDLHPLRSITIANERIYATMTDHNTIFCFTSNFEYVCKCYYWHPIVVAAHQQSIYVTSYDSFKEINEEDVVNDRADNPEEHTKNALISKKQYFNITDELDFDEAPPVKPMGIAVTAESIYITDSVHNKHGVSYVVRMCGKEKMRICGYFQGPRGIAIDDDGNIFIADTDHHRVLKFDKNGEFQKQIGGEYSSDEPNTNLLCQPYALLFHDENIYVCDRDHSRIVVLDRHHLTFIVSSKDDKNLLAHPADIAYDHDGKTFYVVTNSHKSESVVLLRCIHGRGARTRLDVIDAFSHIQDQKNPGLAHTLMRLHSIAIYKRHIYVADIDRFKIICFTTERKFVNEWSIPEELLSNANEGIVLKAHEGFLHICLPNSYTKFNIAEMQHGVKLHFKFSNIPDLSTSFDMRDAIYPAEKIRGIAMTEKCMYRTVSYYEGNTQCTIYSFQICGLDGDPISEVIGSFLRPRGIAVDNCGCVYVVDSGNNRIIKFNSNNMYVCSTTEDFPPLLHSPHGIVIVNDYVYVCDNGQDRIAVFDLELQMLHYSGDAIIRNPIGIAHDRSTGTFFVVGDPEWRLITFKHHPTRRGKEIEVQKRIREKIGNRHLSRLRDIAIENDYVYVTEIDDHTIVYFTIKFEYIGDYEFEHPTILQVCEGKLYVPRCGSITTLSVAPSLVVNVYITTEDDNEPDIIDEAAQFGFPKLALKFNCRGRKVTHQVEKRLLTETSPSDLPVINLHIEQDKQDSSRYSVSSGSSDYSSPSGSSGYSSSSSYS